MTDPITPGVSVSDWIKLIIGVGGTVTLWLLIRYFTFPYR